MTSNVHPFRPNAAVRLVRVGAWVFEPDACRLHRDGEEQKLTPKSAAVLDELVRAPGQVVARDLLFERVWPASESSQDLLNTAIKELRRALGDELRSPSYIETIPKVGYRLIAAVSTETGGARGEVIGFPQRGPSAPTGQRRTPYALAIALAALALLVVAVPMLRDRSSLAPAQPAAPKLADVHYATSEPGAEVWARLSPDGGFIAYSAPIAEKEHFRLLVRAVDGTRPVRVTRDLPDGAYHEDLAVWSPDGANLAFLRLRDDGACSLHIVSALGGVEREVHQCRPFLVDYFDWAPDGRFLVLTRERKGEAPGLAVLDLESGDTRDISYAPRSGESDIDPKISPDGRHIAFRRGAAPFSDLWVVPIAGGEARRVTQLQSLIRGHDWLPDGRGLVVSSDHEGGSSLYALDLSDLSLVALGERDAYWPDIATRRNRLVFQRQSIGSRMVEYPLEPEAAMTRAIAPSSAGDDGGQYAPDDGRVVFVSSRSGARALWLYEPESDSTRVLARAAGGTIMRPRWSHDGKRVTYTARQGAESVQYVVDARSAKLARVNPAGTSGRYGSFAPDGRALVYSEQGGEGWRIVQRNLDDPSRVRVFARSLGASDPVFDLAGRYIYYTRVAGDGLFRLDAETGAETLVSNRIAYRNMDSWILDGARVLFLDNASDGRSAVYEVPVGGGEVRLVREIPSMLAGISMALSADRRHVLVTERGREDHDLVLAEIR
ncbi:MAG TPA: winged helix-turn-helix domain-containing protein [Candidatus Saccharimonadia bacterium]|nr:winged helix-turn-helix domain-containing protein [Candidatus Saccharimonadia bacterium]